MKISKKKIIVGVLLLFFIYLVIDVSITANSLPEVVPYEKFENSLKAGNVDVIYYEPSSESMRYCLFNDETRTMDYKERSEYTYKKDEYLMTYYPSYENFRVECLRYGCRLVVKDFNPVSVKLLSGSMALIIPCMFIYVVYILYKQFSKFDSNTKLENLIETSDVTFDDVIGHEEILSDVKFIVELLKNPTIGDKTGARLPKGILFSGEPGTGKTLIAKAIAGEADVPFIYMNASSFIEMYVGLGAKRVRDLFQLARKHTPCIIFIDEIDAVGGKRNQRGSNSENDQTLNALLQEMDGFSTKDGVFVIGATNTPEKLDKALKRAGRFDREIVVNPPRDWNVRHDLFEHYLRSKNVSSDVNIETLARQTVGFTGADIESIVNEAAIIASMAKLDAIDMDSMENAIDKHVFKGNRSKERKREHDREIVAYHEAGHAITSYLLGIKIARASIIGTVTGVGGAVFQQEDDNILLSNEDFINKIKVAYGGRASEEIKYGGTVTVGASNDITQATGLIEKYIHRYGFDNEFGLLDLDVLREGMLLDSDDIIAQMSKLSKKCYNETKLLLSDNYALVERLAQKLLEVETLSGESIKELLEGGSSDADI